MAFKIFPKSPKSGDAARLALVDDAARGKISATRPGDTETSLNWVSYASRIEVEEAGGLSPSLENAALMFAHGNESAATAALMHALNTPEHTQPMVWMCLFDLFARGRDRTGFEELALRFVVAFERSAPAWDEMAGASSADANSATGMNARARHKSLLRGVLTDPQAPVILALVEASKRKDATPPRFDLDVVDLDGVSDVCGMLLAGSLAALRRKGAVISIRGLDATTRRLSSTLQQGDAKHKGLWYLVLELLQWSAQGQMFEDRAVDFAITFGISPPSMEPLTPVQISVLTARAADVAATDETLLDDRIVWLGELKGPADLCLKTLSLEAVTTNPVIIDMRRVLRVDFVCGGAIANAITGLMAQAIDVRVVAATPIIQTLLQLTGTPAGLFAKA